MSGMQQPVLEYHSPSTVVKMRASLVLLAALIAVAYAAGQYYVPRSYYVIDSEGHETAPVPLRRLRRSFAPSYTNGFGPVAGRPPGSGDANANANAYASGGGTANANANAFSGRGSPAPGPLGTGGYQPSVPYMLLGASQPKTGDFSSSRSGIVTGPSVSATTNVGVDGSGLGYYDQEASVGH